MRLENFQKNPFTLKPYFYSKLLEIHLNNKKNMIELIKSMEELIHEKKKSNSTVKYVVNKILEIITLNIHTVQKKHNPQLQQRVQVAIKERKIQGFLYQNSFSIASLQNPNVQKMSKENKTFTILILVQIYSSNL